MDESKTALITDPEVLLSDERAHLKDHWHTASRGPFDGSKLGGLALSGGGIRSASFAFGVMQALAEVKTTISVNEGDPTRGGTSPAAEQEAPRRPSILQRLHYLSTVSGGGFAGAALTKAMLDPGQGYDLGEAFPFRRDAARGNSTPKLEAVRLRASYLDAQAGPAKLNFIAIVARTIFLTAIVYLLGLSAVIALFHPMFLAPRFELPLLGGIYVNPALLVSLMFLCLLAAAWFYYSLRSGLDRVLVYLVGPALGLLVVDMLLPAYGLPIPGLEIVNGISLAFLAALVLLLGAVLRTAFAAFRSTPLDSDLNLVSRKKFEQAGGWLALLALLSAVVGLVGFWPEIYGRLFPENKIAASLVGMPVVIATLATIYSQMNNMFGGLSDRSWQRTILVATAGVLLISLFLVTGRALALLPFAESERNSLLLNPFYWRWVLLLAILFLALGKFANLNYVGLHRFYRDKLHRAFLQPFNPPSTYNDEDLDAFCRNDKGLYHLINANVVLVNSSSSRYRARGGDSFVLSPLAIGSGATGWLRLRSAGGQVAPAAVAAQAGSPPLGGNLIKRTINNFSPQLGTISFASAMAVSGAALNPSAGADGGGPTRSGMLPLILNLLGIRLGYWQPMPDHVAEGRRIGAPDFVSPGVLYGLLQTGHRENRPARAGEKADRKVKWIELTDGGHFENMGLYELFRRRVKLIIAADGTTDPDFSMSSFASAYERARNDFGIELDISNYPANFNDMMPDSARPNSYIKRRYKLAEHGFAIGKFYYKGDPEPGYLFYVNTVLTEGLRANLYSYKADHPEFPDEPLTDQFFNEKQFDAYCQLGYELTNQMVTYAKGYDDLSRVLEIEPNEDARGREYSQVYDPDYFSPEQLLANRLNEVTGAISGLSNEGTVERIFKMLSRSKRWS